MKTMHIVFVNNCSPKLVFLFYFWYIYISAYLSYFIGNKSYINYFYTYRKNIYNTFIKYNDLSSKNFLFKSSNCNVHFIDFLLKTQFITSICNFLKSFPLDKWIEFIVFSNIVLSKLLFGISLCFFNRNGCVYYCKVSYLF